MASSGNKLDKKHTWNIAYRLIAIVVVPLVAPPGTGKTPLAKAVAGEAAIRALALDLKRDQAAGAAPSTLAAP